MTQVFIDGNIPQGSNLIAYIKTLPFVEVVEHSQKTFAEAARECNAVSVDEFCDKLEQSIKDHYRGNA